MRKTVFKRMMLLFTGMILLMSAFFLMMSVQGAFWQDSLSEGMRHYYKFDNDVFDFNTTLANNLNDTGGTTNFNASGVAGQSYLMGGGSTYLRSTNVEGNISGRQSRTYSIWGYKNSTSGGYLFYHTKKGENTPADVPPAIYVGGVSPGTRVFLGPSTIDTGTTISLNTWNHFVLVYDGASTVNRTLFYLNGALGYNSTDKWTGTDDKFFVGIEGEDESSAAWVGYIDELGIWNRALSGEEISLLYASGHPPRPDDRQPTVVLSTPANATWFRSLNNTFVCNSTAPGSVELNNVTLYAWNATGSVELSNKTIISGLSNSTPIGGNVSRDGTYTWNCIVVLANSPNNQNTSVNNRTFYVDTMLPNASIVQINTSNGSQTITFAALSQDANLGSCKFSILNDGGSVNGLNNNLSYDCNNNTQATVTAFGAYSLITTTSDLAGNENSSTLAFNVTESPAGGSGGGGGGGGGSVTVVDVAAAVPAANFSISTTNGGKVLDMLLAKHSVRPKTQQVLIINRGIDPIEIELQCDLTKLETNQSSRASERVNICNYVRFNQTKLTVTPNERRPTVLEVYVSTPPKAEFGDVYEYNLLALSTTKTNTQFSKLSVTSRVTYFGLFYKSSYVPLQGDIPDSQKRAYLVAPILLLTAFALFFGLILVLGLLGYPLTGIITGSLSSLAVTILGFAFL